MILSTASLAFLLFVGGSPAATTDAAGAARVTIEVNDGGTKVENQGRSWVSVTPNEGKAQVLPPGGKAELGTGTPDATPSTSLTATATGYGPRILPAPSLVSPRDGEQVTVKTSERGPGQVLLSWTPVPGAREYTVEFTVDNGKPNVLKTVKSEAKLPPIQGGKVAWAVRTVGEGAPSEPSGRRWFQVQAEPIRLEAKGGGWK
ncbi:MAG TPA: hypothetical protein VFA20_18220 [Myxococcaceae bacterium]|nr:hypothetical protein [Myxococcaceae bacterium]